MSRKSKRQQLAEAQDPAAPFLFDEAGLPMRDDLVLAIKQERHKHTGASLVGDDRKAQRLVELLTCGWGVKRIAMAMEVSPHTVRAARAELVRTGAMAPFKQRVVQIFEDIIEVGSSTYLEDLERGVVQARDKPVHVAVIWDKRALALGEPTAIGVSAHASVDQGALSVQALNSWVESLPAARVSQVSNVKPAELPPAPPPHVPSQHAPQNAQESEVPGA